jgi:putative DNA double-strand break repair rad50 ATPase
MKIKFKDCILLILFLLLICCNGKKQEKIKNEDNKINYEAIIKEGKEIRYEDDENIKEVSFVNDDKDFAVEINKIMSSQEKYNIYVSLIEEYKSLASEDEFKEKYTKSFLNEKGNFALSDKTDLDSLWEDSKYDNFDKLNRKILQAKGLLLEEPKYKELDVAVEGFINAIESQRKVMKEIKDYYITKEYEKDKFQKGKILNDEYFNSLKNTEEKYKELNKSNKKVKYFLLRNAISVLKRFNNKEITGELLKLSFLTEMLTDNLFQNKNNIEKSNIFKIETQDKNQYINNLKSIQKTLRITLENLKKISKDQIKKEMINELIYDDIIKEMNEASNISALIIKRIEEDKNKEINELIILYQNKSAEPTFQIHSLLENKTD